MAYLIRNLINDAYKQSGVVGIGQTMSASQTSDGLSVLNFILDEVFATDEGATTIALPVTFTGVSDYTIGPVPDDIADPTPDIVVNTLISDIDYIVVTVDGVRQVTRSIDPISYTARPLDTINNTLPYAFYYEKTNPVGTIRFYEGTPTGPGELVYKPSIVDVTANTDMKAHPRAIKPYLMYELAARIAEQNGFDASQMKLRASKAWRDYKASIYQGQSYRCDGSAPGVDSELWYNIYRGD